VHVAPACTGSGARHPVMIFIALLIHLKFTLILYLVILCLEHNILEYIVRGYACPVFCPTQNFTLLQPPDMPVSLSQEIPELRGYFDTCI
jgi:hypothetical protein